MQENEAEALLNFARRYVAPKQRQGRREVTQEASSRHTGLRVAATLTCQKAVLAEPPPPRAVDVPQKLRLAGRWPNGDRPRLRARLIGYSGYRGI